MKRLAIGVAAATLAFWVYAYPWLVGHMVPVTFFITRETFFVEDAIEGQSPRIVIARTNHRDFKATYLAVVRRDSPLGPIVCRAEYSVPSSAGSLPPEGMTLERWVATAHCTLGPGTYVLITHVHIPFWLGATVNDVVTSNLFTIHPKE